MRFVVDQCVPVEVASWLTTEGHQAWTAFEAGLSDADDEGLIAYAHAKGAMLVTTNGDCGQLARRLRSATVLDRPSVRQHVAFDFGTHTASARRSPAPGVDDRVRALVDRVDALSLVESVNDLRHHHSIVLQR